MSPFVYLIAVLSNDKLYGCDEEFVSVLDGYATDICQELLVVLKALGDNKETKKQYNLTLELFWRVIRRADLEQHSMLTLAANLWMLSKKIQDPNNKLAVSFAFFIHEHYNRNFYVVFDITLGTRL